MKNFIFLTLVLLFSVNSSFAQDELDSYSFNPELKEIDRLMSKGQKNSYSIIIDGVSKKDIDKAWGKYMKNYDSKVKWNKDTKEYLADDAKIPQISDNTIDVYSQLHESGNRVELIVWMDLGGAFLSTYDYPNKVKLGEAMVVNFATEMEKVRVGNFQKQQEGKMKDLNKELDDMQKDKGKMEKDIADMQKKIEETNGKIEANVNSQTAMQEKIKAQGEYVERVKVIKAGLGN